MLAVRGLEGNWKAENEDRELGKVLAVRMLGHGLQSVAVQEVGVS